MARESHLFAQQIPVNRPPISVKQFAFQAGRDSILIDSVGIIPISLEYRLGESRQMVSPEDYDIYYNKLVWLNPLRRDSIGEGSYQLRYRRISTDLTRKFRRIDTSLIQQDPGLDYIAFSYSDFGNRETLIDFDGMNYSGSFSRGLSFGNRQNLVLNSSLNLQLAGTLGNDLQILAAISDNDIPIQPEGNTQQLQEFDRIYIEISKDENTLRAGDFEIGRPNSYFMNYFKRSQGVMFSNVSHLGENKKISSSGSVAISKGKFRRQFLVPQEGNQGPYKLFGNDGEVFIIVLANTEKVFLDGQLLKRGLEYDYVIDYNRGDITFTAKQLIHKDLRIIVEFEYSDQNYLRSMYTLESTYESEKLRIDFNYFSEQDSKNSPGTQQLTDEDILLLAEIGDDLDKAFVSSIRPPIEGTGLPTNAILYEKRDTILPDGRFFQEVLVFSTNAEAERFSAAFTDVGQGNGDYIIGDNLANGRVYQWVAPDPVSGRPRGRYVPSVRIITPKKQQMMTIGATYTPTEQQQIKAEFGLSSLDVNRFSPLDSDNNTGVSGMLGYEANFVWKEGSDVRIKPFVFYEFKEQNFRAINQYRSAEFQRDWNIDVNTEALEHLATGGFEIGHKDWGNARYAFSGFFQENIYNGTKHEYDFEINRNGLIFKFYGSELQSEDMFTRGSFSRPRIDISQTFKRLGNWRVGVYGEREKNEQFLSGSDELAAQSFYWDIGRVYIQSPTGKKLSVRASYTIRDDILPFEGTFQLASRAQEYRFEGTWKQSKNSQLIWNFTSRALEVPDTAAFSFNPQNTYLGRINYNLNALKNVIRSTTAYEIGSGQEPRLEFTYIEVRPGEGQYIWVDLNKDGIQQLDEFQIAPFQDEANFIRVANVTNEFVRTNNILLNQQLLIDPRAVWYKSKGWKKALSKFSAQSNLNLQRKSGEGADIRVWDPFQLDFEDESIVFLGAVSRNSLFFNRAHPKFEVQFNMADVRNRNLLTTGFESRRNQDNDVNVRWNPGKALSLRLRLLEGRRGSDTEAFESRNFDIKKYLIEQEITIQPGNNIRTIARINYSNQVNERGDRGESAETYQVAFESVFNKSNKFSLRSTASAAIIRFDGQVNSPLEFAMLEGLKDGLNILWNFQYDQRMANNIQLIINYEGRKTGEARTVHVFRMQMRATF